MTSPPMQRRGPLIIAVMVVLLLIAHQDNWFWNDDTLVFGFLPIGLFWHACISIAAALVWWLATRIAWPSESDDGLAKGEGSAE
ncbi:MAG: DUF3311 domain-containing protein [Planctomycetota bacterium]